MTIAAASSSSGGRVSRTLAELLACVASSGSENRNISLARCRPTILDSSHRPPPSGTSPTLAKLEIMRDPSAASRTSPVSAIEKPTPAATSLRATIRGISMASRARVAAFALRIQVRAAAASGRTLIAPMSPAQKARPASGEHHRPHRGVRLHMRGPFRELAAHRVVERV
nr:hypothetical protein [Pseudonocardia sp. KRD291]